MEKTKLFDTVAIINPVPMERLTLVEPDYTSIQNLPPGQVGTIVEVYERADLATSQQEIMLIPKPSD
jgi:hypothetical protein